MCDYSLQHVTSRPARIGDKLVTSKFRDSITGGFAALGDPDVAVCLQPGSELAFESDVECDPIFRALPYRKVGARVARFRRTNEDYPHMHHDALEFPDGTIVLLTHLREGQHASVLQLPSPQARTAAPEARAQSPSPVAV